MSQTELGKWLNKYFQQSIKHDQTSQDKFIQLLDRFAAYGDQLKVIRILFDVMQCSTNKDNLKAITKKYFYVMNLILDKDDRLPEHKKYKNAVSHEIVTHYITMLKQLLRYQHTQLIMLAKIFRKKWAKKITDEAFDKINSEAAKQLNKFNLDRGFPEDTTQKIIKGYKKRGFSQIEIDKYMCSQPKPVETQTHQEFARSESSQEQSNQPTKRVKKTIDEEIMLHGHDMMNPHSSYIPSNSFPMHPKYQVHNSYNNFYPTAGSYPYPPSEQVRTLMPSNVDYQYSNNNFYPNNDVNPIYPNMTPQSKIPMKMPTQSMNTMKNPGQYDPRHAPMNSYDSYSFQKEDPRVSRSDCYQKSHQILRRLRQLQLYQCRYCGVELSTLQHFTKHSYQHFNQRLKEFQGLHSRRDNAPKKLCLPMIEQWVNSSKKTKQQAINHHVPIKGASNNNNQYFEQQCVICKSILKMSWSCELSQWVYDDAIKISVQSQNQLRITHYDCYTTLEEVSNKISV